MGIEFNSETIKGRANVAKATVAGTVGAVLLYKYLNKKVSESSPDDEDYAVAGVPVLDIVQGGGIAGLFNECLLILSAMSRATRVGPAATGP